MFKLAYKKDPQDSLDKVFTSSTSPGLRVSPSGVLVLPEYTPISQQGGVGSCAANAICDAFEHVLGSRMLPGAAVPQLSRLSLYYSGRCFDGTFPKDDGMYIRSGLRQLAHVGCALEDDFPYIESNADKVPAVELTVRASENRINGYRRIASENAERVYQVQQSIAEDRPVVFGTHVGAEFQAASGERVFGIPHDPKGGHAMVIVGFRIVGDVVHFRVRNSWGRFWGQGGYTWITASYLTWELTSDLWAIDWAPDLI